MDLFVKLFIKASVSWLVIGGSAGFAMAVRPEWTVYRAAHAHMVLLGFVSMMIFGVGYHVIPRFAGAPLRNHRWPITHWWIANSGLLLMVGGLFMRASGGVATATYVLAVGGAFSGTGALIFAAVIWEAIDRPAIVRRARPVSDAPPLRSRMVPVIGQE